MKLNHRGRWTAATHEELVRLADQGLTPREIADRMQRTEEAIGLKARQHGIAIAKKDRSEGKAPSSNDDAASPDDAIDEMVRRSIEEHGP